MIWIRSFRMGLWTMRILVLLSVLWGLDGLEITRLSIPSYVKNGTEESVVLDCEYEYSDTDDHLVVKWYLDDDPYPVYQWITELNARHLSEKFQGRINLDYVVPPGNDLTKHRALNILRPTTELSGKYSCHVASFDDQDDEDGIMTVYAPPTAVHINYTVVDDVVNVTCEVEGVYPLPKIEMFQIGPGEVDPSPVEDVDILHFEENDSFRVLISTEIPEEDLETDNLRYFGCNVTLPGTEYEKIERIPYFPPAQEAQVTDDDNDDNGAFHIQPLMMTIVLTTAINLLL